jgi:hypothetical protein
MSIIKILALKSTYTPKKKNTYIKNCGFIWKNKNKLKKENKQETHTHTHKFTILYGNELPTRKGGASYPLWP